MNEATLFILLIALLADWRFGEPTILWSRLPHPVVLFGKSVSYLDRLLNLETDSNSVQLRKGGLAIAILIGGSLVVAHAIQQLVLQLGIFGWLLEGFIVFVLLAQKSLYDHVFDVAGGLADGGLAKGREAVSMIVGRDSSTLDRSGVSRAAIESLAENFSDGVVAPAFWYAIFGLPGLIAYKMINTADSMIAYQNEKYLYFGRAAAQIDDLANWLPARISAGLIALGAGFDRGYRWGQTALLTAFRESRIHRSPNAGWPEAAMAGGADLALGGPRIYEGETVPQTWINANGIRNLDAQHIRRALGIFAKSCYCLWAVTAVLIVL